MGEAINNKSGNRPLVFLGVVIILLILSAILSFKIGAFRGSFLVEEALICQELNGFRQPLRAGNNIFHGARQVCLWLKYSSAREGGHIDVSWYYNNDLILSEKVSLTAVDGVKTFYLLRDEGTPLPSGSYRVTVSASSRQWAGIDFYVYDIEK